MNTLLPLLALFTRALREDVRAGLPIILRTALIGTLLVLRVIVEFNGRQATGQLLLGYLATLNFIGITLLGLSSFGAAITEEKEDETLGLLRMTRLNPLAILFGKSTSRLVTAFLLLVVQIPFAVLCAAMGGVLIDQILEVYLILGAYLFFLCNLGLLASVIARTTVKAILISLATGLLLFLFVPLVWNSGVSIWSSAHPAKLVFGALFQANPALDLIDAVHPRNPAGPQSPRLLFAGGILCFVTAWLTFERFCWRESPPLARSKKTRRFRKSSARPWRNAVAWKEYYFAAGGLRGLAWRLALYAVVIGAYLWLTRRSSMSRSYLALGTAVAWISTIGLHLEVAFAAAFVFGRERRQRTLSTLLLLPISTAQLIWRKVRGFAIALLPAVCLYAAGTLWRLLIYVEYRRFGYSFKLQFAELAFAIAQLVLLGVLIAYLSLRMRRGALITGLVIYVVWSFTYSILVLRLLYRFWSRGNEAARQINTLIIMSILLVLVTVLLARRIPRRLAACAAEE